MMASTKIWLSPPLLALIGCVLLLGVGIGQYDLWPSDEPRFAEVAREMVESGDFLVPRVNGEAYREKPPLLFWCISFVSVIGGEVNEVTARIPSLLAALMTLWCTYLLARRLYDPRIALWAMGILATTNRFWWQARTVQIDMVLTSCLTAALLCFWCWHKDRQKKFLVGFYIAMAFGLLAKGPPALVFPLLLIAAFYWKQPMERKKTHYVLGSLAAIAVTLAWLIPARLAASVGGGSVESEIGANLFRQTIGRFIMGVSHAQPPWYYIQMLPVDLLPWSFFLPYTIYYVWKRRRESSEMRLLLAYTIPAFIFFSISIGKRQLYLLPLYPVFAILIARSVVDLMESSRAVWRKRTAFAWCGFLIAVSVAPVAVRATEYGEAWTPIIVLFPIIVGGCSLHALLLAFRTNSSGLARAMTIHIVLVEVCIATLIFPAMNPYKSARAFCAPVRELTENSQSFDVYTLGFSREEYIFYNERFHVPLLTGLLDLDLPNSYTDRESIELQTGLRKTISRAVRDVPISDFLAVTDLERRSLQETIDDAVKQGNISPEIEHLFIEGLREEMSALSVEPKGTRAAVVYMQEEDYRWLLPISDALAGYAVLHAQSVGSRDMLLLANEEGAAAIRSTRGYTALKD